MADLVLTSWTDQALAQLLVDRPDLRAPLPGSLDALATRATTIRSAHLALTGLDTPQLAVLDAVLALHTLTGPPTTADVAAATGLSEGAELLQTLAGRALLLQDGEVWHPVEGVLPARGEFPAGLALTVPAPRQRGDSREVSAAVVLPPLDADSPAARLLEHLAWQGPVGTVTPGGATASTVAALQETGLLVAREGHPDQVVVPAPVALAVRGGRTHRDVPRTAPVPTGTEIGSETVAAEAAHAALELVRLLAELDELWSVEPGRALRSGGLGVREVRRLAQHLSISEATALLVLELAAGAGEIGVLLTPEETLWAPVSGRAPSDAQWPQPEHWARVVLAWWSGDRVPSLAGSTDTHGTRRAPLEPGLERGWARQLRGQVLAALTRWPTGSAPSPATLHQHLAWARPLAPAPLWAIEAVLTEAAMLGLVGAGALAPTGQALLDLPGDKSDPAPLAAALEAILPPAVATMMIQADLTAVVPGRPDPQLAALLDQAAQVESRGGALTARFTPGSLAAAVEDGVTATELLQRLTDFSSTPLPQALEYAVRDVERRHARLRIGGAGSYLRSEDEVALAELVAEPRLELRLLAPTVAVSALSPGRLAELARPLGRGVLLEGPDGSVVAPRSTVRAPAPRRTGAGGHDGAGVVGSREPADPVVQQAVARLRRGQQHASDSPAGDGTEAVRALRAAVRTASEVDLMLVGPSGEVGQRRVRPLRVDAGALRARDLEREIEVTVALHRIVAAEPVSTAPVQPPA